MNVTFFACVINGNLKKSDTIKYDLRMTVRCLTRVFHTHKVILTFYRKNADQELQLGGRNQLPSLKIELSPTIIHGYGCNSTDSHALVASTAQAYCPTAIYSAI